METKRVKMTTTFTPDSTGRALYAGGTYDLPEDVAKEVVDAGAGELSRQSGEATAPESAAGTPVNTRTEKK